MKKNMLFALGIILLAILFSVIKMTFGEQGLHARVEITDAETLTLPLDQDGTYQIDTARLPVTLEVSQGRIRFVNSQCPDHICEGYGWLSREHDQAVCMPAGVVVSVE